MDPNEPKKLFPPMPYLNLGNYEAQRQAAEEWQAKNLKNQTAARKWNPTLTQSKVYWTSPREDSHEMRFPLPGQGAAMEAPDPNAPLSPYGEDRTLDDLTDKIKQKPAFIGPQDVLDFGVSLIKSIPEPQKVKETLQQASERLTQLKTQNQALQKEKSDIVDSLYYQQKDKRYHYGQDYDASQIPQLMQQKAQEWNMPADEVPVNLAFSQKYANALLEHRKLKPSRDDYQKLVDLQVERFAAEDAGRQSDAKRLKRETDLLLERMEILENKTIEQNNSEIKQGTYGFNAIGNPEFEREASEYFFKYGVPVYGREKNKMYYDNGKLWADKEGLNNYGILPNGEIVSSKPLSREQIAKMLQKPDQYQVLDFTDELQRILRQVELDNEEESKRPWPLNLISFYNKVKSHGPLDVKYWPNVKDHMLFVLGDEIVDKDVMGNIVYGYAGKKNGIPDEVLRSAAGAAQLHGKQVLPE